jgi:hypothetical protein
LGASGFDSTILNIQLAIACVQIARSHITRAGLTLQRLHCFPL